MSEPRQILIVGDQNSRAVIFYLYKLNGINEWIERENMRKNRAYCFPGHVYQDAQRSQMQLEMLNNSVY